MNIQPIAMESILRSNFQLPVADPSTRTDRADHEHGERKVHGHDEDHKKAEHEHHDHADGAPRSEKQADKLVREGVKDLTHVVKEQLHGLRDGLELGDDAKKAFKALAKGFKSTVKDAAKTFTHDHDRAALADSIRSAFKEMISGLRSVLSSVGKQEDHDEHDEPQHEHEHDDEHRNESVQPGPRSIPTVFTSDVQDLRVTPPQEIAPDSATQPLDQTPVLPTASGVTATGVRPASATVPNSAGQPGSTNTVATVDSPVVVDVIADGRPSGGMSSDEAEDAGASHPLRGLRTAFRSALRTFLADLDAVLRADRPQQPEGPAVIHSGFPALFFELRGTRLDETA